MSSVLACPEKYRAHQRNYKGKTKEKPNQEVAFLLLFPSFRSRSSHSNASLKASSDFSSRLWGQPPYISGGETVQDRLAALLIGDEVPDLEPVLTSPCLPPPLCPQEFLLASPVRTALEEMLLCLGSVRTPAALSGGKPLRPHEVLTSEAMTHLQLVEPRSEPLVGICWARARLLAWSPKPAVPVLLSGSLGFCPRRCCLPLNLCDRALQVCQ